MGRICEICGVNPAMYVCSNCGRNVCSQCFEKSSWLCIECYNKRDQSFKEEMLWTSYPLFIKIFLIGFLLAFLGMIILMVAGLMEGVSQASGIIVFIGPIPIMLGVGKPSLLAIFLAILLTIIGIVLFFIFRRISFQSIEKRRLI